MKTGPNGYKVNDQVRIFNGENFVPVKIFDFDFPNHRVQIQIFDDIFYFEDSESVVIEFDSESDRHYWKVNFNDLSG